MAASPAAPAVSKIDPDLFSRLHQSRSRTDALFRLLPPNSFYERPVSERHRLIFYLGHLEAFDWNLLAPVLGLTSHESEFDKLFAFGIDPVDGGLPTDLPRDWPSIAHVENYAAGVRARLDTALHGSLGSSDPDLANGTLLQVAVEHRLMHAETLAYLFHNLPAEKKSPGPAPAFDARPAPEPCSREIPAGIATLGQTRRSGVFGWDNEFESQQVQAPSFSIGVFPVTNHEYLQFIRAGGYQESDYWRPEDREWLREQRIEHPEFWVRRSGSAAIDLNAQWDYRSMFGMIPLQASWPVYVSYAEAAAFSRWAGKKLPTEAQWHRAAYGTPEGTEREYPWGDSAPDRVHGNFHHERWDATPVDIHPAGASGFGIFDLLGNGWEWTSTPFEPFPGFVPFSFYPGYSANFFDGKHFVMKGGSPRTDACMLRRSFRNWFQPHYRYTYATFRCVEE